PARRGAEYFDMLRAQPGFFVQFPIHRLDRGLVAAHAALRKLPAVAKRAPRPEHTAVVAHEDDADVRPITIRIDHGKLQIFCADSSIVLPPTARRVYL